MSCIFCKIITQEIPSQKIYEDEHTYAFLDIHPVNIGHTIVIPKIHSANIYEIPDIILTHLSKTVKKLAITIKKAVIADGINIVMNNDSAAGQIIFHAHIHIVPRFSNDGFTHWRGARNYHPDEMSSVGKKITNLISI